MNSRKDRETAYNDFIAMTVKSWTFDRLTEQERERLAKTFVWAKSQNIIKGSYNDRWRTMQGLYHSFLDGVGYTDHKWREEKRV